MNYFPAGDGAVTSGFTVPAMPDDREVDWVLISVAIGCVGSGVGYRLHRPKPRLR